MKKYRGFEGEVAEMNGLDLINAQGNYDQGRGADGLHAFVPPVSYLTSRYGTGVPVSNRPASISGKATPPGSLDPQYILPARYIGRTDYTREELLKKFPAYSGPMATTSPVTWHPRARPVLGTPIDAGGVPIPHDTVVKTVKRPRRIIDTTPRRRRNLTKGQKIRNRQKFINWVKNWNPKLYLEAKAKADAVEANEGTLGQLAGWWDTFTTTITDIGGKYLQFRTQKEILEAQLERMRQGEPPLDTSQYAPTVAIKPDPGTTREITGAIGAGFGSMLPWIAVGGVALLLLLRRR